MASEKIKKQSSLAGTILVTGLLAGTLDICAATIKYLIMARKNPAHLYYYIASGVFGKDAAAGSSLMAIWGLLFHYIIAIIFTAFYFLVYPKIKFLSRNIVLSGLVYGIFTWLVMNGIVLPLSNTPAIPFNLLQAIVNALILMFAIGLPVAILAYRYYLRE